MQTSQKLNTFLLISGMIGLLVITFIFDFILEVVVARNEQGGMIPILVWLFPILDLVWVLLGLGLFWFMLQDSQSRLVKIFYLVVVLALLFTPSLLFVLPVPESWLPLVPLLSPDRYLFHASAMVAGIGLLSLVLAKRGGGHPRMGPRINE